MYPSDPIRYSDFMSALAQLAAVNDEVQSKLSDSWRGRKSGRIGVLA